MIEVARARLAGSWQAVAAVFANTNLRRLEIGRIAATVSASGTAVVYVLLAYRAGEAEAVAALIVVTTWTAAIAFPIVSTLADRFPRKRVIVAADVVRIALLVVTAVVAADAGVWVVILLSATVTVIGTASSSARAALVPELARDSAQLIGANALAAMTASTASLVGPAIAGVAVALHGPDAALVAFALASSASAVAALRIEHAPYAAPTEPRKRRLGAPALGGLRALVANPGVRVVVLLTAAQTFVGGVLAVLLVLAVIETLELGETGPSYLAAALSAGTLLGSVALLLVGERRLAAGMAVGLGLWGLAAAAVGLAPAAVVGIALIALVGLGDALADLSALTIVQRLVPNDVLARALGSLRGLFYSLASIGSLLAPLVVDLVGIRAGLIMSGVIVPVLAFAFFPRLIDSAASAPSPAGEALQQVPLFATLSPAALERVAAATRRMDVDEGSVIVREGDDDRGFYVVAAGAVEIDVGGRIVANDGVGAYFGEIATVRGSPRTATVRATAATELYFVPGEAFLEAVSGDDAMRGATERLVAARLARAV